MRVGMISIPDPEDVRAWSGIPFHVLQELRQQVDSVEILGPLDRKLRYLYAPSKLLHRARNTQMHLDRHPLMLRSYARQIDRALEGKSLDALFCMSTVPIAHLSTRLPVFFWCDAVLEGMADYYPGDFARLTPSELRIGHAQEQAAIDRAAGALYSSHWAAGFVQKHYANTGNVRVVEFGANLPIGHDAEHVASLLPQRLLPPYDLLFLGVDWVRKGGPLALEATEILNRRGIPATLHVAGCTAPASPYVKQHGFLSKSTADGRDAIHRLLSQSSLFLFPTRAEAAGIVFAEASAFGLPILSTDTGGVTDYVNDGVNGFCLPLEANAEAYADKAQAMLTGEVLYRQLSAGAFDRYAHVLNWQAGVRKLVSMMHAAKQQTGQLRASAATKQAATA